MVVNPICLLPSRRTLDRRVQAMGWAQQLEPDDIRYYIIMVLRLYDNFHYYTLKIYFISTLIARRFFVLLACSANKLYRYLWSISIIFRLHGFCWFLFEFWCTELTNESSKLCIQESSVWTFILTSKYVFQIL